MNEVSVVVSRGYSGSLPLLLVLWEDMEEQLGEEGGRERRGGGERRGREGHKERCV